MSRQINLYSSAFRAPSRRFSAAWLVTAAAVVVVASIADYAWEVQRVKQLQAARTAAETQLKQLREQLVASGQQAQKGKSTEIADHVARAEALFGSGQELLTWLQSGAIGNREGYAKSLNALARQHLDGVWLTAIEISGARNEFILKGRALRADLVPAYIKTLRNEAVFRGASIGTLALREIEIDAAGDEKPAPGPGAGVPVALQARAAHPAQRAVEFSIGTEGALPAKDDSGK